MNYGQQQYYPNQGFNQQFQYGQPGGYMQGFNQQPVAAPQYTDTLTEEEAKLAQTLINPQFDIRPTERELIQAKCNHRYKQGQSALNMGVNNNNEIGMCARCGTIVDLSQRLTKEQAEELTSEFCNMQEVIKFGSFGMNTKVLRDLYGNTLPFNRKMGKLYERSINDLNSIQNPYVGYNDNIPAMQVYAELNNATFQPYGYQNNGPMMNAPGTPIYNGNPAQDYTGGYVGNPPPVYNNNGFVGPNSVMNNQQQTYNSPFYNDQQMQPQQPQQMQPQQMQPQQPQQMQPQQPQQMQPQQPQQMQQNNITTLPTQKTEVKTGKV